MKTSLLGELNLYPHPAAATTTTSTKSSISRLPDTGGAIVGTDHQHSSTEKAKEQGKWYSNSHGTPVSWPAPPLQIPEHLPCHAIICKAGLCSQCFSLIYIKASHIRVRCQQGPEVSLANSAKSKRRMTARNITELQRCFFLAEHRAAPWHCNH